MKTPRCLVVFAASVLAFTLGGPTALRAQEPRLANLSTTAQVGAGASVVLFTTGLGTPTGNPIAPVVKLSTNSELAHRMQDIIAALGQDGSELAQSTLKTLGEKSEELVGI